MGWFGSLNVLNNLTFYKLDVINNINWQFTGLPVSVPETIYDLISGWNWISFAPQLPQDINFALTSLGNAGTNIKNQTESAIYYDGMGWFGSLTALLPQEGYMLRTSEDVEFIYPELIARNNRLLEQKSKVQTEPILRDFDPHLYEFNAVMIVSTPDELPENSRLVAYCQEEVRSLCQILDYSKPFGRKFYSLMLYSNFLHESAFQLFYQQSETDPLIPLELSFDFVADITMGDFIDPVIVQLHTTDNDQIFELTDNISAYPNPFNPFTTISFSLQQDGRILLDIYNIKAQKVETLLNEYRTAGQYRISWNAENLPSGIYLLKYSTDNSVIQRKLVLIK
jgi:hypothetical protein